MATTGIPSEQAVEQVAALQPEQAAAEHPEQPETGSGWGGTRIPTDDFIQKRRKAVWGATGPALPPRVYVDNKNLIREVGDLSTLRRGDHCLIALNPVRAVHPTVDWVISFLGSIELLYLYHHFIMIDDVSYLDDAGVPRNSEGKPAMLFECANTVPEAWTEVRSECEGRWHLMPYIVARFLVYSKTKCTVHALADYGDTPQVYLMLDKQTPETREQTVQRSLQNQVNHDRYHAVLNNCEHTSNMVKGGSHRSQLIEMMAWTALRVLLGLIGVLALQSSQNSQMGTAAYHFFAVLPVALQVAISYAMIVQNVQGLYEQALIGGEECYHLLSKELGRAIVVGGMATAAIYSAPHLISSTALRVLVLAVAYRASDALYNCLAHTVMRLVLLPSFGKVWLLSAPEKEKSS